MRKLILFAVLLVPFVLIFSPVLAQTADGLTPAEEDVCADLKADGVTKGLYGLCVAYCEAEASSERILEVYNRRMVQGQDPEMPSCRPSGEIVCPCWDQAFLDGVSETAGITPFLCLRSEDSDLSLYQNPEISEASGFDSGFLTSYCTFIGGDGSIVNFPDISVDQEVVCRALLRVQQDRDFVNGCL